MTKDDYLAQVLIYMKKYGVINYQSYIDYYEEYIDDLIDNGLEETDLLKTLGTPKKLMLKILSDDDVQVKSPKRGIVTVALLLGIPVWAPMLLALFIIGLVLILTLGICTIVFGVSGIWTLIVFPIALVKIGIAYGLLQFGVSFIMLGASLLLEQITVTVVNGMLYAAQKMVAHKQIMRG